MVYCVIYIESWGDKICHVQVNKMWMQVSKVMDKTIKIRERHSFTYLFQWFLECLYKDGNIIGTMTPALSLIKLITYSLFQ